MKPFFCKALSLITATALIVSAVVCALPTTVSADEVVRPKYVSLGDSMTNGYGMPGYDHNGFLHNAPDTYPEQLADTYQWEHIALAVSGMRAEDLQFVLEFPWDDSDAVAVATRTPADDGYTAASHGRFYEAQWWADVNAAKWYDTFDAGDFYTWDESITVNRFNDPYYDVMAQNGKGYGAGVANISRLFQESIADADVISLAVGNANFGVFMRSCVMNALGLSGGHPDANAWIDNQRVLSQCDPAVKATAAKARAALLSRIESAGIPSDTLTPLLDAVTYAVTSYLVSMGDILDTITAVNPAVEVIIVGLINTLSGMEVKLDGHLIDLGRCMAALIDTVNAYLAGLPAVRQQDGHYPDAAFYYASASEVNMWVEEYDTVAANWEKYPIIRDRFITKTCDTLFPLVRDYFPTLSTINRKQVEAYEAAEKAGYAAFAEYVRENGNKALSVSVYKAFENAIVQTYSMDAPDVTALLDLENGLDAAVASVIDAYRLNTDAYIAQHMDAFAQEVDLPEEELTTVCTVAATPDTLNAAIAENDIVCDLLSLLARLEIGDGIGCHPSTDGHNVLAAAVIDAYGNRYTAKDATEDNLKNLLTLVLQLTLEYGDDVFAYAEQDGYFTDATSAPYAVRDDSHYTAFGDAIAASTDFADAVATELNIGCTDLSQKGQKLEDIYAVIDQHRETVDASDLITLYYGNTEFFFNAVKQMTKALSGAPVSPCDWASLVGDENVHYVDTALAEIRATLITNGLDQKILGVSIADVLMAAIEAYAYDTVSYIIHLPDAVAAIREINPDAVVVIVGMHNPMRGTVLTYEDTAIDIGSMLDKLVEGANMYGTLLCTYNKAAIFVKAPDITTKMTDKTIGMMDFLLTYAGKSTEFFPVSGSGDYLAERVLNALDVTIELTPDFDKGDINTDGKVTIMDAVQLYYHVNGKTLLADTTRADINGDGKINITDAVTLYYYVNGKVGAI